ncbi:MAG: hypothetical protein RR744_10210, partial [Cellulosilyticaceae bacterium]
MVEKKLPGKGWEYMVYDKADRLVLSQDANLATTTNNFGRKGWLFTKYDSLGRIVYTGFFANTATRTAMQTALDNMRTLNVEERTENPSITLQGLDLYYTKTAFPTGSMTLLTVNYYDTYPVEATISMNDMVFDQTILTETADDSNNYRSTKSMALASFAKNIEDDRWTKTYSFYDDKGRVIATNSVNYLGGNTSVHSRLDMVGTVLNKNTYHNRLDNEIPIVIAEEFIYDDQNRLVEHYHTIEDYAPRELLAYNQYDELGRLAHKKVGGNDVTNSVESTDYDYNIRGWMTGINLKPKSSDASQPVDASKLFSYKIKYDDSANPAREKYNGGISEIDWIYKDTGISNRYEYTYDKLDRLKAADYKTVTGISTTADSKYYNEEVSYDINGNIKTLKRYGKPLMGQAGVLIDNLNYTYSNENNSNQLLSIYDASKNKNGYPYIAIQQNFTYDQNGNIATILDKGISSIKYNYLNLPNNIVQKNNNTSYVYRADGAKLFKSFFINGETLETEYLDGFVYTTLYSLSIERALRKDDVATREVASAGQMDTFELVDKMTFGPGNPPMMPVASPEFFSTAEGFYDYKNSKYIYQYKD